MKKVIIMRAVPGSGKTTETNRLVDFYTAEGRNVKVCSTDWYSMVDGEYRFDINKLGFNHTQNKRRFLECVSDGVDVVIVDNTNTTFKEYREYMVSALFHGYDIDILEFTPTMDMLEMLFKRNVHGVPKETMIAMIKRFQPSEQCFQDVLVKESMCVGREKIEIFKKEIHID